VHYVTLKKECQYFCELGVLEEVGTDWASPTFIILKKDGTLHMITDFHYLHSQLKCKPYLLPNIHELLHKCSGFKHFTKIDTLMVYYTLELDEESQQLHVIVFPWGKFKCEHSPMRVSQELEIFQTVMTQHF